MFEVGDKVRICKERIDEYHNNKNRQDWVEEADELFRSGRVFTIVEVRGDDPPLYYLDEHIGGSWREQLLVPHTELPGDLFEI